MKTDYDMVAADLNASTIVKKTIKKSDLESGPLQDDSIMVFCGTASMEAVKKMYSGNVRYLVDKDSPVVSVFGTQDSIMLRTFANRDVLFLHEPSFDDQPGGRDWSKSMLIVKFGLIQPLHLGGYEQLERRNIGYPAQRSSWSEFIAITGLCMQGTQQDYVLLENVSDGQADKDSSSPVSLIVTN